MTDQGLSPWPEADEAVYRSYLATRLDELACAFTDSDLLSRTVSEESAEGTAFHGYVRMKLDALVRTFHAADRADRAGHGVDAMIRQAPQGANTGS